MRNESIRYAHVKNEDNTTWTTQIQYDAFLEYDERRIFLGRVSWGYTIWLFHIH